MSLERWHLYAKRVPYIVGPTAIYRYDEVIQIQDLPGPFYLRQLEFNDDIGRLVRCRNGLGNYFMSDFLPVDLVSPDPQHGLPIMKELEYPFNSQFRFDYFQPLTEVLADMWVVLHGAHKLADSSEKLYPDNFRETPYTHPVNVTLGPNMRLKIPLVLHFNIPFEIRGLTAGEAAPGVGDPDFEVLVNIQDHNGQSFFNTPMPWNLAFAETESNLMVTPSPCLVMPPGRAYTLEVVTGAGTGTRSYQFNFVGALLNAV